MAADEAKTARARRTAAAERYRPEAVRLLLVAEAPPGALDRYFYFENVTTQDSLFRYVCRGVLGAEPTRASKAELLARLRDNGVYLIDLKLDPVDGSPLARCVPDLVRRCKVLAPAKIVLIKAPVFDAAYASLKVEGLPVSSVRVPFPGSGRQQEFETMFAKALRHAVQPGSPSEDRRDFHSRAYSLVATVFGPSSESTGAPRYPELSQLKRTASGLELRAKHREAAYVEAC